MIDCQVFKIEDDLQEELLTKLKSSTVFENHPKGRIFNQFLSGNTFWPQALGQNRPFLAISINIWPI